MMNPVSSSSAVNIGIIGLGHAGMSLHLPKLCRNTRASILAVADIQDERLTKFSLAYPNLKVKKVRDYQELLEDEKIQAVFVTSPTPTHFEIAMDALRAGKHVFCEKPISSSVEEATQLVQEAESRSQSQVLMIGHVIRYWPDYVAIKRTIDSGTIGEPVIARAYRAIRMPDGWEDFYGKSDQSGGVLFDLSIHDIDFLIWCLGNVSSVYAQGGHLSGRGDRDLIDYAQVHLDFESGAMAYVESNWAVPKSFPFTTAFEISCRGGMVSVSNSQAHSSMELTLNDQEKLIRNPWERDGYFLEEDAFLDSVTSTPHGSPIAPKDALYSLKVANAARESIHYNGKEVFPK